LRKYLLFEPTKKIFAPQLGSALPFGAGFIAVVQSFRSYPLFRLSDRCICQVVLATFRLFRSLQTKEIKKLPRIAVCSRNRVLLILFHQAELEIYFYKKATYSKEKRKSITTV
jgi:hypothetical protein